MDLLIIEHKDGRRHVVPAAVFRKDYEPEGFKAVRYESRKPYEPPATKAADKPKDEK